MHALQSMKVFTIPEPSSLVASPIEALAKKDFTAKRDLKQWRQNVAADLTHFPVIIYVVGQVKRPA